jgi:hypothetical protein
MRFAGVLLQRVCVISGVISGDCSTRPDRVPSHCCSPPAPMMDADQLGQSLNWDYNKAMQQRTIHALDLSHVLESTAELHPPAVGYYVINKR